VAAGKRHVRGGLGRERAEVARDPFDSRAPADPECLGLFLVEANGRLGAADLEPQVVLAPGRDLRDHGRADQPRGGLEHHDRDVLRLHSTRDAVTSALEGMRLGANPLRM
jgi:hypothetical protein